ncbi:hypothetical protein DYQ86_03815 [Acidobacteria bacterium AB60]|nr:hypothetical protein DYQ86_03815 [Acidobacteria bacterium AB60]
MSWKKRGARWAQIFVPSALVALTFFTGCGGGSSKSSTTQTTPAPVVSSFISSAPSITAGESATLTWTASNATTLSIDNGVGTVNGTSTKVKPTATTTYTLTASNSGGTVSAKVTVTVVDAAAINSFVASDKMLSPMTVGPGSTTLTWDVSGATTVSIDNAVGTVTGTSVSVSPAATTTYTLTAANSLGSTVTATVTVAVRSNLSVLNGTAFAGTDRLSYLSSMTLCGTPNFIATDGAGNIYATDQYNAAVCKITPAGNVTVLASNAGSGNRYSAGQSPTHAMVRGNTTNTASKNSSPNPLLMARSLANKNASLTTIAASSPTNVGVYDPLAIAVTPDGSAIYFSDDDYESIRKITIASDGTPSVSFVAGVHYGYVDGPGSTAEFGYPVGLSLDQAGNLYIADEDNCAVRKIAFAEDGSATVSTLAGGTCGETEDPSASLGDVEGVAAAPDGKTVFVSDWNGYIRKIAIDDKGAATVSTVAGNGWGYLDGLGSEARFEGPIGIALTPDGSALYVADARNNRVRKVALNSDGTVGVSTVAGADQVDADVDGPGNVASFLDPLSIALGANGTLYVSDSGYRYDSGDSALAQSAGYPSQFLRYGLSFRLRQIDVTTQKVSSLALSVFGNTAGSADGVDAKAAFNVPFSMASDATGNVYVSDWMNGTIRKIALADKSGSSVSTVAGTPGLIGYADGVGVDARFNNPLGMAIDPSANLLYVADTGNSEIRKLDLADGHVTTLVASDRFGSVGQNFQFEDPVWLALEGGSQVLYIVDASRDGIFSMDLATGDIAPLKVDDAALLAADPNFDSLNDSRVMGLAVFVNADGSEKYLYASTGCAVYQIDLATSKAAAVAGSTMTCGYQDGTGVNALFSGIINLDTDSQGNVYAADADNSVVRRITPKGVVSTVVGTYGSSVTSLTTAPGSVYLPLGVLVDSTDNLLTTVPNAVLTLNQ